MDSVTATGVLLCGGVPATRATVRLASADSQGNRVTLTEVKPDENGLFSIQGTETEIAMPDFWLEIMHYCSKTRPVVERKYERYIDPFYYYNARETRTPWIYAVQDLDLLDDS
ncbi:hypothetical protein AAVH_24353 [Aphelenchoides avenae]|nr:hypothetical protein AAVH_24353 [Aphelenchus avenae]